MYKLSTAHDKAPAPAGALPLHDGQQLDLSGLSLKVSQACAFLRVVAPKPPPQVMHTPGHTSDSICLWHASSRTLLCADTVLGWGSTTVGDLGDYMQSLEALRALQPQPLALLPGHGPPIVPLQQQQKGTTPVQLIQQYIDHRSARIAQA